MPSNRRSKRHRRRRARVQLDPHYFVGLARGRTSGRPSGPHTRRSWVHYDITLEEVLADLAYGQD